MSCFNNGIRMANNNTNEQEFIRLMEFLKQPLKEACKKVFDGRALSNFRNYERDIENSKFGYGYPRCKCDSAFEKNLNILKYYMIDEQYPKEIERMQEIINSYPTEQC